MIIEFVGLPGAGKSSLEHRLLAELVDRGFFVISRTEAISQLIAATFCVRRRAVAPIRRVVTLLYKLGLFFDGFRGPKSLLHWRDLGSPHRVRSAMRVAEDLRLYRFAAEYLKPDQILNISEGVCQHTVAQLAWREMLGGCSEACSVPEGLPEVHALVVHVNLPARIALERLVSRGVPKLWPPGLSPEAVVTAFQRGIAPAVELLSGRSCFSTVLVDGESASPDWRREAVFVANTLQAGLCEALAVQ